MNEAKVLQTEPNSRYRTCKESVHIACLENTISQHSLDLSPIWIPLISKGINK